MHALCASKYICVCACECTCKASCLGAAYILLQVKAGDKVERINDVPLCGMPPPFVTRLLIGAAYRMCLHNVLLLCVVHGSSTVLV